LCNNGGKFSGCDAGTLQQPLADRFHPKQIVVSLMILDLKFALIEHQKPVPKFRLTEFSVLLPFEPQDIPHSQKKSLPNL
jgi:hypothetical protein